jgi:hypothetical protein
MISLKFANFAQPVHTSRMRSQNTCVYICRRTNAFAQETKNGIEIILKKENAIAKLKNVTKASQKMNSHTTSSTYNKYT